ncbi:TlpA family protein disulfide reductase [Kitasatospora sp. NPDC086009]|uniref:TlpA family protein disulfide reductase n=1 Tax=unclassified Kitasatospora TaxID=2633591 RepID=UPI0037C81E2A
MTTVSVILVGCLSVFNLLLTLVLARKITLVSHGNAHGHSHEASQGGAAGSILSGVSIPENKLPDGAPMPAFRAVSHSGGPFSGDDLTGDRAVVGFFSTTCGSCLEQAPDFVKAVTAYPGGRERVVAVVKGTGPVGDNLVAMLEPVARVVVEPAGVAEGSVAEAFGVVRWPSYVDIDAAGRITNRLLPAELTVAPASL